MKYPLSYDTWDENEIAAIKKVIESKRFTIDGFVKEFECKFAEYIGSKYCVMTNSGSSANLLAVASLTFLSEGRLKAGDEVVVPAIGWSTTYAPLMQYGLKLKFVDVDVNTLNYDLHKLSGAISDETKLVVVINVLGNPNDFGEIHQIIRGRNIFVFEDNCEGLGAKFNGIMAGTFGDVGTVSSFFSHHISTVEGGVVLTDDEEIYHILLSLRSHGWTRDLPSPNKVCEKTDNPFYESFRFILPGYNVRPTEINGAIGIEQLKKIPYIMSQRRANANIYEDMFSSYDNFLLQEEIGSSSWFGFSLVVNDERISRDCIVKDLINNGIECRPIITGNFVRNEVMKWYNYEIYDNLSNADFIHNNGFFVGNNPSDLQGSLTYLKHIIDKNIEGQYENYTSR